MNGRQKTCQFPNGVVCIITTAIIASALKICTVLFVVFLVPLTVVDACCVISSLICLYAIFLNFAIAFCFLHLPCMLTIFHSSLPKRRRETKSHWYSSVFERFAWRFAKQSIKMICQRRVFLLNNVYFDQKLVSLYSNIRLLGRD